MDNLSLICGKLLVNMVNIVRDGEKLACKYLFKTCYIFSLIFSKTITNSLMIISQFNALRPCDLSDLSITQGREICQPPVTYFDSITVS